MKSPGNARRNPVHGTARRASALVLGGLVLGAVVVIAQTAGRPSDPPSAAAQSRQGVFVSDPVAPEDNEFLPLAPTAAFSGRLRDVKMHPPRRIHQVSPFPYVDEPDTALDEGRPSARRLRSMPALIRNFEGVNNVDGVLPPDTNGEVGRSHYVQMVNLSMAIYSKATGARLSGPFHPSALWPASSACRSNNDGDPVVLYDQLANRWLVSQFALPLVPASPFYQCIAVSKTGTPTNRPGDWWAYTFKVPNNKLNDYPKLAVWPDAYYMSVNQFLETSFAWGGAGAYAFERAKMLSGQPARLVLMDVGTKDMDYGGMLPSDLEGSATPPAGTPNYFVEVDDASWIGPADALRFWKFHVDWATPANSTFGLADFQPNFVRNTAAFNLLPCVNTGSRNCIPQKGGATKLDSLGDRLMFRLTYRRFAGYDALLVNHTVKVPGAAGRAGIRWYEIRDPGVSPTIFQQGTYAPSDGAYRWMGSIAMDKKGNIALGYTVSGTTLFPSIRYAGRLVGDPRGTLPQAEASIVAGTGAQTHSAARWGDYSDMTVDPVDGCTFWYTQEYIATTGPAPWRTRVASFKFPGCS